MSDPLELVLRPITNILNRNISETTPARRQCAHLADTTVAVRVRNSALAMYFTFAEDTVQLSSSTQKDPDVVITGSLLTLARMTGASGEQAIRDGSVELTGDARQAQAFQTLLSFAAPDLEEELSNLIGDATAHRIGAAARGVHNWARAARSTMASNIREYVQEESRDAPSRYETERFSSAVGSLRDDVDRLEARINRLHQTSSES